MDDPFIGRAISKYVLEEHIGRGATADVYKAYQPTLDRYVAIKLLHRFLADNPDFLERFQREAKAIARLRHPNIVQVYDFDVFADIYYLAMEYIDGHTLKTKLQELAAARQVMPLDEALRITRAVAQALSYAHSRDMVHRDIKPANIMLAEDDHIVLMDFGLAKILGAAQHTASGVTVGTPAYASPEQVLAQPGDPRSDIYSLGVVLFHMLTGQLPYTAETGVAIFLKHLTDPLPSPRQFNPNLPPDVETIIRQTMAKKPEDRYQTADDLITDLDRLAAGLPIAVPGLSPFETTQLDLSSLTLAAAGQSPGPERAAGRTNLFDLPPYVLSPDHVVTNPADLPAVCDADWDRAVAQFLRGYFTAWMREGVNRLRATHQHGLADDLETIVERAEAIVRRAAAGDAITRNAALEEFLLSLGAEPPILEVSPQRLELPPLGVEEVGEPVTLTLTNKGRGYLFGQVVRRVPWLTVEREAFGCGAGQSCQVLITPNLSGVPAGRIELAEALLIRSIGGAALVAAHVDVLPAELSLSVSAIDFGVVGQGETARATVAARNSGRGFLVGSARALAPWLSVAPPAFSVPAGRSLSFTVEVDTQLLEPGCTILAEAVSIESNGGRALLSAQVQVEPPRLAVEPEQLDLGTLDLAQPGAGASADVQVRNAGLGVLIGSLKPDVDWLSVEPAAFRCRSGEAQHVRLSTGNLKTGDYRRSVRIVSNAEDIRLPIRLRVVFSLEPETIVIPAGEFVRGSGEREQGAPAAEQPQQRIYLEEYRIGKYPVTNAQYAAFLAATRRKPPEHWVNGSLPPGLENHPVVNVSWNAAAAYCAWLSEITGKPYRLPAEAQWEKAARGIDGRTFPWGHQWDRQRCNTLEDGARRTTPVGTYSPAGDSPYGCADMCGNVWEWVADWYAKDYYAVSTTHENPRGPAKGAVKVMRGGSYGTDFRQGRAANRSFGNRSAANPEVGFRCAIVQQA
ncbi:MAG TPA: SUMF1/EgtB/PvdO family nonheme iron enzyme [Anaerolineae bacterium]|nr:SUMF1/EgtB/PvdO family nonheme iron enzyme [Anaerolineae bacterium]